MVYPEFFWIPEKLGVKNGGKSSPSENPNFLKIPEIVGVTPSFSIVGLFLFGDLDNVVNESLCNCVFSYKQNIVVKIKFYEYELVNTMLYGRIAFYSCVEHVKWSNWNELRYLGSQRLIHMNEGHLMNWLFGKSTHHNQFTKDIGSEVPIRN